MSEFHPSNNYETPHFTSEARLLALAEPNPAVRLALLQALISEGDIEMVDFALAALQEQPDNDAEDPTYRNTAKITGAQILVGTLADKGLFEHADRVIDTIGTLHQRAAVISIIDLLHKGYARRDNAYLHLDFTESVQAARIEGRSPQAIVFNYLSGLAAYGVDVFDHRTEAGRLWSEGIAAVPQTSTRDYHYNFLAYSLASGGHVARAITAKNRINDPYWRSVTCAQLAGIAQEHNNTPIATMLTSEACELLALVSSCEGSCGRAGCNPGLDVKEIEIEMALVFAKQGQQAPARELVGTLEPTLAYSQALVYTELYKMSGDVNDRAAALIALTNDSVLQNESLAETVISDIGTADWRWGNTIPSLDARDESVPLICWELHGLYAEKHRLEQKLESGNVGEDGYRAMDLLGIDPLIFLRDLAESRDKIRDRGLAVLIKLLVSTGAPETAKSLLGLIETPVEKVRAMSALGKAGRRG